MIARTFITDVGREGQIIAFPDPDDTTTPIIEQSVHRNTPLPTLEDPIHIGTQNDFRSKGWVAHCHINEHSEVGMMGIIKVVKK